MENFKQYNHGKIKKSFSAISKILSKAKFMVDLSIIQHDGGGTQYTFLETIHNKVALIITENGLKMLIQNIETLKKAIIAMQFLMDKS